MRRISLIALLLGLSLTAFAQRPYYCITKGAELQYAQYGPSGVQTGGSKMVIKDVSGSNGTYSVTCEATVLDNEGGPITEPLETSLEITNGNISMSLGQAAGIDFTGDIPSLPSRLAVGMELDGGKFELDLGLGVTTDFEVMSNQVVDREELTNDAGTFKCYIVETVMETKILGRKTSTRTKTWYARGVGSVKMESYDQDDNLVSTQELISYTF